MDYQQGIFLELILVSENRNSFLLWNLFFSGVPKQKPPRNLSQFSDFFVFLFFCWPSCSRIFVQRKLLLHNFRFWGNSMQ